MREWKITCDHCGVEISGNPFQSVIEHVGRETDGHVLRISVCPARPGIYKVIYFLKIADETVICRAMINVSEA